MHFRLQLFLCLADQEPDRSSENVRDKYVGAGATRCCILLVNSMPAETTFINEYYNVDYQPPNCPQFFTLQSNTTQFMLPVPKRYRYHIPLIAGFHSLSIYQEDSMSRFRIRGRYLIPAMLLCTSSVLSAQTNTDRAVLGTGGVSAGNAAMTVSGTLGQPIIGSVVASSRSVQQGFWFAGRAALNSSAATPGDNRQLQLTCLPNPVNHSAVVHMTAPSNHMYSLSLHDLLGREVRSLRSDERATGSLTLNLETDDLPAGHYSLVLISGSDRAVLPVTVIR